VGEAPVFSEPWQAQAFALAAALQDAGVISRQAWSEAFSAAIARVEAAGEAVDAERYHQLWAETLAGLVEAGGLASHDEIETRRDAWEAAYERTPHGQPVEL
jgi:nitrile hydratase accessory protein